MKSRATPRFWSAYRALSSPVQEQARRAYLLFKENPAHPSLQLKKVGDREPIYSARVTRDYRALGLMDGGGITMVLDRLARRLRPPDSRPMKSRRAKLVALWFAKIGSRGMNACNTAWTATFRCLGGSAGLRKTGSDCRSGHRRLGGEIFAASGRAHLLARAPSGGATLVPVVQAADLG